MQRQVSWGSFWLGVVAMLVVVGVWRAGANEGTHRLPDQSRQRQSWAGDLHSAYTVSGCLPTVPAASLSLGAFACEGYVKDTTTGELHYVAQASAAVGPLSGGNGTYWLALHRDLSTAVSGWTRQAGTQYLWQLSSSQPVAASGTQVITRVTVAAGAISAVADLRL
jgi:hypothetical protein